MNRRRCSKKAVCIVCGAVFQCFTTKAMFCSESCRAKGKTELDYNERHRRHEAAKAKLEEERKRPATIETIARWQAQHRKDTGEWLGYPKAVERMRQEGYAV